MKQRSTYLAFAILVIAALVLSACAPAATATPTTAPVEPTTAPVVPTEAPAPTDVPAPTEVPATEVPEVVLGTAENPIIMAMAPSSTSQELIAGGEAVAAKLKELTGLEIKTTVPTSYAALIEAMGSGNAHVGWLPPLAYLLAKQKEYAEVGLAVMRFGSDHYGVQFVANADSGFTPYFDPATNESTGDEATAVAQFADKKPCWTDPLSASGYVLPSGILAKNGVKTKAAAFVQGHPTVITALYAGGICDFGATYIDARTTSALQDKPNLMEKVVVIYRTDELIPNDNVSFASSLDPELVEKLTAALEEMSASDDGKALLKSMGYDVESLKRVDDTFYDEFRVYLQAGGLDITTLVK